LRTTIVMETHNSRITLQYKRRYNVWSSYYLIESHTYTVKPYHAFTFIKQSTVLKSHLFLVLSQKISYELNLFHNFKVFGCKKAKGHIQHSQNRLWSHMSEGGEP
jgi:hypothetical protein